MLRLEGIRLTPDEQEALLLQKTAQRLRCRPEDITALRILCKAIDAREGLQFIYTVAAAVKNEQQVLRRCRDKRITPYKPEKYRLPAPVSCDTPPVVVGMGPGGLFAALVLAKCGLRPIVLERGEAVEQRRETVETFWRDGVLNTESNVQFGEGGAGAFSDGKLNTGTKDVRHRFILQQLVACGAPETILYDAKPHVGTDMLYIALQNLRRELLSLGADIRFGHRLDGVETDGGQLTALRVTAKGETYTLPCRHALLALGHSARDTVEMLYESGVHMEAKPFAVGVRIEHRQADIDAAQYRQYAGHPALSASSYKLSCHLDSGRSAFSFCVCPGGTVVAAASEDGRAVTNGMSEYARDKENINGALLVNVTPDDFPTRHPLAGIAFQRQLEEAAFALGGGDYRAPAQRVEDFLLHRPTAAAGAVKPSYRPGVTYTDLHRCLPPFVAESIAGALPLLGSRLRGYDAPDALLTAVESRSSSPVKIPRDEGCQCNIRGIYPCGEGAGYAGGILSAAADGMRCAEAIIATL
ncbi:MAG: FAD-dependent monooxygenase [Oscillospiraceae bacterium]|nr:FAD-dependent monooxygenase [Oscillospiraceae bacterium]